MRGTLLLLSGAIWDFVSQRVSSLRLTAERSSVLDGEETSCLVTATPNHITVHSLTRGWGTTPPLTAPLYPLRPRRGSRNLTYCNHISTMAKPSLSFQTSLIRIQTASQRTLDHYCIRH